MAAGADTAAADMLAEAVMGTVAGATVGATLINSRLWRHWDPRSRPAGAPAAAVTASDSCHRARHRHCLRRSESGAFNPHGLSPFRALQH
jgi:hypothetical protein